MTRKSPMSLIQYSITRRLSAVLVQCSMTRRLSMSLIQYLITRKLLEATSESDLIFDDKFVPNNQKINDNYISIFNNHGIANKFSLIFDMETTD
ncbi:10934_t:CDS:2, partial [Scutellospora calospora]